MSDYAFTDPHSELVALRGGPRDHRWFYYRDWIATRRASRRLRTPLDRHCASDRCYAPTTEFVQQQGKTTSPLSARVWTYLPPAQWHARGREYHTPEEHHDPHKTQAPHGDVTFIRTETVTP